MAGDALKRLTEKWKLCPQEALLLFISVSVMSIAVGLCASSVMRKKRLHGEGGLAAEENGPSRGVIKKALMGSLRWSGRSSWGERDGLDQQNMPGLLAGCKEEEWGGMSSPVSPLWQRRILMGERCKLPKFSGVILYDEQGLPLRHSNRTSPHQERPNAAVTTTLGDLFSNSHGHFPSVP